MKPDLLQWQPEDSQIYRRLTTAEFLNYPQRKAIKQGYLWHAQGPAKPFTPSKGPQAQSYALPIALVIIPLSILAAYFIYYQFSNKAAQGAEDSVFATLVATAAIFLGLLLTFAFNSLAVNAQAERLAEIHKNIAKDRSAHYLLLPDALLVFTPAEGGVRLGLTHQLRLSDISVIDSRPDGLAFYTDTIRPTHVPIPQDQIQTLHQLILQQAPHLDPNNQQP